MQFQKAAVIGTGMMGPGIALSLTLGGLPAVIVSRSSESAVAGREKALAQLELLDSNGLLTAEQVEFARASLSAAVESAAVYEAVSLVVESAPEDMAFKQDLFARIEKLVPEDAVLTSNTSGLSITEIAAKCERPERVFTTHFWNPPHLMPFVEIVMGKRSDASIAGALKDLLKRCGKVPVVVKKDTPGQLGNRLQMALVREAVNIVEQGIADPEDVDLAAMAGFGLRLPAYGIFEHQDIVGLELGTKVLDYVASDLFSEPRAPELPHRLMAEGHTGAKAGRGYYDWSSKSAKEVVERRDAWLLRVLRMRAGE